MPVGVDGAATLRRFLRRLRIFGVLSGEHWLLGLASAFLGLGWRHVGLLERLNDMRRDPTTFRHLEAVVPGPLPDGLGLLAISDGARCSRPTRSSPTLNPAASPTSNCNEVLQCVTQSGGVLLG